MKYPEPMARGDRRYANWLLVTIITGILLFLVGTSGQAMTRYDPWELGPFIEGDEVPPKDIVIVMKGVSVAPEGSAWHRFGKEVVIKAMERATNGLVTSKYYGGGLLGGEADTIRKMRMRQLHWVGATSTGVTMIIPEMCVMAMPFLFDWEPELFYEGKYCEVDYILEKLENSVARLAAKRGFQLVGLSETSFAPISSQFPLKSVEDFRKLKPWLFRGDQVRPHINKAFGPKRATSSNVYDVVMMLATGMADSSAGGWYIHSIMQWCPYVKYATDYPIYGYEGAAVIYDRRVVERLKAFGDKWGPRYGFKDGREVIRKFLEALDREITRLRFDVRRAEVGAKERIIKSGSIQEVHFPQEELEKMREMVLPLYDELADNLYPRWLLDEILQYRAEYRELKAAGKLDEFWETGILPGGNQFDQWRTQWGEGEWK